VAAALLTSAAFAILVRRVKGLASLALVLILLKSATALRALVHGLPASGDSAQGSLIQVLDQRADPPIAVLDPEDYVRFRLFGPNRIEKRMVLVSVLPGELPTGVDPAVSDSLYTLALSDTALHRFISVPVQDFSQFIDSHSRFLLLQGIGSGRSFKQKATAMLVGRERRPGCLSGRKNRPTLTNSGFVKDYCRKLVGETDLSH